MSENGNLPANPVKPEIIQGNHQVHLGLTKREEFSAKFMAAILSNPSTEGSMQDISDNVPAFAIQIADAFLKELDK